MGQLIPFPARPTAFPDEAAGLETAECVLLLAIRWWVEDYRAGADPIPRLCEALDNADAPDAAFSIDGLMTTLARLARRPVDIHCPRCPALSADEKQLLHARRSRPGRQRRRCGEGAAHGPAVGGRRGVRACRTGGPRRPVCPGAPVPPAASEPDPGCCRRTGSLVAATDPSLNPRFGFCPMKIVQSLGVSTLVALMSAARAAQPDPGGLPDCRDEVIHRHVPAGSPLTGQQVGHQASRAPDPKPGSP
jgi:hypothetical protein